MSEAEPKPDPQIQALYDALSAVLDKYRKSDLLDLCGKLIDARETTWREYREMRYLVNEQAEVLKITGTTPMNQFEQLLRDAFYGVLDELEIEPEVEAAFGELADHYRPDEIRYYDFVCSLQHEIEPRLREALLPFITLEGYAQLVRTVGEANLREADYHVRNANRRERERLGIRVVEASSETKKREDDA
jgi:hypothetical protein